MTEAKERLRRRFLGSLQTNNFIAENIQQVEEPRED